MPLRFIARYLMNHPEVIDKLANSYPFRRAAQMTASMFFKGKGVGADAWKMLNEAMERNGFEPNAGRKLFENGKKKVEKFTGNVESGGQDQMRRMKEYMEELKKKQMK